MAQKTSLRDFQAYLAERLSNAAKGQGASSWLGLQAGETHWLIDLTDSGEIIQTPRLTQVPLTQPWFAGVANIRGNLHAVVDLSMFIGGAPTARNNNARLLLVGTRYGTNAALLVSRMLGLKNPADFNPQGNPSASMMGGAAANTAGSAPWEVAHFADAQGKIWRKLSVRALLENQEFMNIGA